MASRPDDATVTLTLRNSYNNSSSNHRAHWKVSLGLHLNRLQGTAVASYSSSSSNSSNISNISFVWFLERILSPSHLRW